MLERQLELAGEDEGTEGNLAFPLGGLGELQLRQADPALPHYPPAFPPPPQHPPTPTALAR